MASAFGILAAARKAARKAGLTPTQPAEFESSVLGSRADLLARVGQHFTVVAAAPAVKANNGLKPADILVGRRYLCKFGHKRHLVVVQGEITDVGWAVMQIESSRHVIITDAGRFSLPPEGPVVIPSPAADKKRGKKGGKE